MPFQMETRLGVLEFGKISPPISLTQFEYGTISRGVSFFTPHARSHIHVVHPDQDPFDTEFSIFGGQISLTQIKDFQNLIQILSKPFNRRFDTLLYRDALISIWFRTTMPVEDDESLLKDTDFWLYAELLSPRTEEDSEDPSEEEEEEEEDRDPQEDGEVRRKGRAIPFSFPATRALLALSSVIVKMFNPEILELSADDCLLLREYLRG